MSAALHALLLESHSATAVLERLCGAPIRIRRLAADLQARPERLGGQLEHRRVALICGDRVLSEADLWFRAELLPGAMVRALAETDAPFGRVVAPLGLRRRLTGSRFGVAGEAVALEHRAVLSLPGGADVAEVLERYGWQAARAAPAGEG